MFNYTDPLATATNKLLSAVRIVTKEVNVKKQVILDAEKAIDAAKESINKAKSSLSM